MQPYPYGAYAPTTGATPPVRYMIPPTGQPQHPQQLYSNTVFDRYAHVATGVRPAAPIMPPVRNPYPPNMTRMPSEQPSPAPSFQSQKPGEQLQPPQPYYYNPYGANSTATPDSKTTPAQKKGAKEYKDTAFTIKPEGAEGDTIRGLVSNDDINKLLTHKGTKVKVAKIYRITKTKSDAVIADSSDDEIITPAPAPPPDPTPAPQQPAPQPPPPPPQRPESRSSSSSCCSCCSSASCSSCNSYRYRRSHSYDNCPECQAERHRRRRRHRKRR